MRCLRQRRHPYCRCKPSRHFRFRGEHEATYSGRLGGPLLRVAHPARARPAIGQFVHSRQGLQHRQPVPARFAGGVRRPSGRACVGTALAAAVRRRRKPQRRRRYAGRQHGGEIRTHRRHAARVDGLADHRCRGAVREAAVRPGARPDPDLGRCHAGPGRGREQGSAGEDAGRTGGLCESQSGQAVVCVFRRGHGAALCRRAVQGPYRCAAAARAVSRRRARRPTSCACCARR